MGGFFLTNVEADLDGAFTVQGHFMGCESRDTHQLIRDVLGPGQVNLHICSSTPCMDMSADDRAGPALHVTLLRLWQHRNFEADYVDAHVEESMKECVAAVEKRETCQAKDKEREGCTRETCQSSSTRGIKSQAQTWGYQREKEKGDRRGEGEGDYQRSETQASRKAERCEKSPSCSTWGGHSDPPCAVRLGRGWARWRGGCQYRLCAYRAPRHWDQTQEEGPWSSLERPREKSRSDSPVQGHKRSYYEDLPPLKMYEEGGGTREFFIHFQAPPHSETGIFVWTFVCKIERLPKEVGGGPHTFSVFGFKSLLRKRWGGGFIHWFCKAMDVWCSWSFPGESYEIARRFWAPPEI